MRAPAALDEVDFSPAELSALRLDGEAFPLGESLVPADQPVDAPTRAASLRPAVRHGDLVLAGRTAAWVHGVTLLLPRPYDLATDLAGGRRVRHVPGAVREVRFGTGDLVRLRGVLVTAPLRTAFDLARLEPGARDLDRLLHALLAAAGVGAASAARALRALPGAPHKVRAIARIAGLDAGSAATRGQCELTR